jgi:hypothetical protein
MALRAPRLPVLPDFIKDSPSSSLIMPHTAQMMVNLLNVPKYCIQLVLQTIKSSC